MDQTLDFPSNCSFCFKSINRNFYMKCAECGNKNDPQIYLCLECYSCGVYLSNHRPEHKYIISDCLEVPIFSKDWTIREELALLDGIDKYGVGNWKTIADYIQQQDATAASSVMTSKTSQMVRDHYWECYMGTHGYCLPSCTRSDGSEKSKQLLEQLLSAANNHKPIDISKITKDNGEILVLKDVYERGEPALRDTTLATSLAGSSSKSDIKSTSADAVGSQKQPKPSLPGSELPGYMPLRGDFDIEYENEAEFMLADMEFGSDDHPSERELKLEVIRIYNSKLQERNRRKKFVIERGLVDFKLQQQLERRRTREERELAAKMRVFARFQPHDEYEALVEGIIRARRLRQQIELYRTYRQLGVRTLEQAREFEFERRQKDRESKIKKHLASAPHLFQSNGSADANKGSSASRKRGRLSKGGDESEVDANSRRRGRGADADNDSADAASGIGRNGCSGKETVSQIVALASGKDAQSSSRRKGATSSKDGTISENELITALSNAPGGELLAESELRLCAQVPMLPSHYLAAKDAIVREAFRNGNLTKDGMRRIFKLPEAKRDRIFDFFVKEMLINRPGYETNKQT